MTKPVPCQKPTSVKRSWIYLETEVRLKLQCGARLGGGKARQVLKELPFAFGVLPKAILEFVVIAARFGRHPNFVQRFLQIHNDLRAVAERDGDHAAHTLVVEVGIGFIVDAIASGLDA